MKNIISKYPILSAVIIVAIIVAIVAYLSRNKNTSRVKSGSPCTSPYGGGQGTINSDGVCVPNDATNRNTWAYAMCRQACFNRNYKNAADLQACLTSCDTFKNKVVVINTDIVPATPSNPDGGVPRPGQTGYGNIPFMKR